MANLKSSKKSIRKIAKRTARNKAEKSRIKTASKKLQALKDTGNAEAIKAAAVTLMSLVDKAGKHGVWHKNKVNRVKSRLSPFVFTMTSKKVEEEKPEVSLSVENAAAVENVGAAEAESVRTKSASKRATARTGTKKKTSARKPVAKKAPSKKAAASKAEKPSSKKPTE